MNDKTAAAVQVVTAVAIKAIPQILSHRRAMKALKAEQKFYEEVKQAHAVDTNSEPIRVASERLA